jgi:chemotaxis protein CheD
MTATGSAVLVGMAEIQIIKGSGQLSCLGLGSCIGLCGFDPTTGVAGMVHVMLPEAFADKIVDKPGKFANTGIPALLDAMIRAGAMQSRMVFAMAGGAQVFKFGANTESKLDIGARNATAVAKALKDRGLRVLGQDVGGNTGRTVAFTVETGVFTVRTVTSGERTLCNLKG